MDQIVADNPRSSHEDSGLPEGQIRNLLESQTASLQALTDGLQQLQHHITTDVIAAIQQLGVAHSSPESPKDAVDEDSGPTTVGNEDSAAPDSTSPAESSWEAIRQAMLDDADKGQVEVDSPEPEACPSLETSEVSDENDVPHDEPDPEPLNFTVPEAFDCKTIKDESLRQVFLEREEILRLMSLHLLRRTQPIPDITTEQLRELAVTFPDDLRQRVESSLSRLDEQLRLTELELSLERARMGRQLTQLEETRHRIETNARQLGYRVQDDGTLEETVDSIQRQGRPGRRWLRVLGFGG